MFPNTKIVSVCVFIPSIHLCLCMFIPTNLHFQVVTSQVRVVWSLLSDVKYFPSRLKLTVLTVAVWPRKIVNCLNVVTSQMITVPSPMPDARYFPFGLNLTEKTSEEEFRMCSVRQVLAFQMRTVLSKLPDAI